MAGACRSRAARVVVLASVAVALSTGLGLLVNLLSSELGSGVPIPVLVVGVVVLAALMVWVTLLERSATEVPVAGSDEAMLARAQALLAVAVGAQWEREQRDRSVDDPYPMPIRWRHLHRRGTDPGCELEDHLELVGDRLPDELGRSDRVERLVTAFHSLRRRRLVLLGAPGTGKTTLAVELVLALLRRRAPEEPVPVLVTLADWDTTVYPELWDWLAARLDRDYDGLRTIAPDAAQRLVAARRVIPVLDGLDEIPGNARPQVITALNTSIGSCPLVLTCRTDEFADVVARGDVLSAALVVEAEPLTHHEIADYLHHAVPPARRTAWAPVLDAIRANAPEARVLIAVCSRPLGLWLTRVVVVEDPQRRDPGALLGDPGPGGEDAAAATLSGCLLAELVPALVAARGPGPGNGRPRRRWTPAGVSRSLTTLAEAMTRAGTRDLLWWRLPAMTASRLTRGALRTVTALPAIGLTVGIFVLALIGAGSSTQDSSLVLGAAFAAVLLLSGPSLVVGMLCMGLRRGRVMIVRGPTFSGHSILTVVRPMLLYAAGVLVLFFGLVAGVNLLANDPGSVEQAFGPLGQSIAFLGVTGGLIGVLTGLARLFRQPVPVSGVQNPLSTYAGARASAVVTALIASSPVPALFVVVTFLAEDADYRYLFVFLPLLLLFELLTVIPTVGGAWLSCASVARFLAVRGRLPWRLMRFLDDARRLGLLRTVGPAYQFRHAELQDHLAGVRRPVPGRARPADRPSERVPA